MTELAVVADNQRPFSQENAEMVSEGHRVIGWVWPHGEGTDWWDAKRHRFHWPGDNEWGGPFLSRPAAEEWVLQSSPIMASSRTWGGS